MNIRKVFYMVWVLPQVSLGFIRGTQLQRMGKHDKALGCFDVAFAKMERYGISLSTAPALRHLARWQVESYAATGRELEAQSLRNQIEALDRRYGV